MVNGGGFECCKCADWREGWSGDGVIVVDAFLIAFSIVDGVFLTVFLKLLKVRFCLLSAEGYVLRLHPTVPRIGGGQYLIFVAGENKSVSR